MRTALEARDEQWASRHPGRAASERRARQHNRAVQKDFAHATFGTPETRFHASRTRQGALARMYVAGELSADELAASTEILAVHERIGRDVTCRTMSLETRVDISTNADARIFEKLGQVRAEVAYSTWRRSLPCPGLVLAVIVQDIGISVVARHWRMRNARARQLLTSALDTWRRAQDDACRDIDADRLTAVHAGLI
jgi:hypothetical protein